MGIIEKIREKAKANLKRIVLPETEDERVIRAAAIVKAEKLAEVILIGNKDDIMSRAKSYGVGIEGIKIVDPKISENTEKYIEELFKLREQKGMTREKAREIVLTEPRYYGALMVRMGDADGMTAGSNSPTADVIRAGIHCIGPKAGLKTVSSCFIMVVPKKEFGEEGVMIYSDCGVVQNPTPEQLADIAIAAAESARVLCGMTPRVALLSHSTKGSASHADVKKVTDAIEILKSRNVDFEFDGELQADAALVPAIGQKKSPGSNVAGKANVLVFPDLDAGNIAYKLTERLTGGEAYGPLLQGLAKPVNDLSRGCSVNDIVNVVAITAIEAQ